MTHVRTQIRQEIVTALMGLTTTEERVFDTPLASPGKNGQCPKSSCSPN